jgi:hypothetical protein
VRTMHQCTGRRELCVELSPVGKSGPVCLVDSRHLLNGEGEDVDDVFDILDFVERERAALAAFQIFVDHLIAADMKIPNNGRHRPKLCVALI